MTNNNISNNNSKKDLMRGKNLIGVTIRPPGEPGAVLTIIGVRQIIRRKFL